MDAAIGSAPRVASALDRRGLLALAGGLLVLLAIVASSAWQAARNGAALERVGATLTVGSLLQTIILAVEDAETGQRGFLLTGQDAYLAPFTHAGAVLPGLLDDLDRRIAGNAALSPLRATIAAKMAELARTVALMRQADRSGALAIVATNVGQAEMGQIRAIIATLSAEQQTTLSLQSARIRRGGQWLVAIDLAGLLLVVGIAAMIGVGLRRYLAALGRARRDAAHAYEALALNNARLDETVRLRTADLTLANEEIQSFAYIVSHDLRAPLVNIMGFTSELEQATAALTSLPQALEWPPSAQSAATEDIPEALRFIRTSTAKMDRLINAILRLSREGRRTLSPELIAMGPLLDDIVASMRHQAKLKDVEITIAPMPNLYADRVAVDQIFGNMVDNAIKYLKPGRPGRIEITARQTGPDIAFAVADNGRGIAAADYERVFELFRRSGDQRVPGEGIGLAHVRILVRRLGGRIGCKSTLDVGTVFTITLPAADSPSRKTLA